MAQQSESQAEPVAAAEPSPTEKVIDQWFVEHFHGTIVSRDTEVYNHVYKAVADLKARLA